MLKPFFQSMEPEAGCDEAGRGCLAGPVFAAAVILPRDFHDNELNDSKKITEKTRYRLRTLIQQYAISWAVASIDAKEIDAINILNASIKAMHVSISQLSLTPSYIIVDGNRFKPYNAIPYSTIIKGDGKFASIAAASILAKTYRDDCMMQAHDQFPQYQWNKNKGYGTLTHQNAIATFGRCELHRKSFKTTVDS